MSKKPQYLSLIHIYILFEVGQTELICRRLEGEFLDYKNAIPRKNPITVIADTKALIESIDRVSVVISDKLKSPVRCVFDHDKLMLSARTVSYTHLDVYKRQVYIIILVEPAAAPCWGCCFIEM